MPIRLLFSPPCSPRPRIWPAPTRLQCARDRRGGADLEPPRREGLERAARRGRPVQGLSTTTSASRPRQALLHRPQGRDERPAMGHRARPRCWTTGRCGVRMPHQWLSATRRSQEGFPGPATRHHPQAVRGGCRRPPPPMGRHSRRPAYRNEADRRSWRPSGRGRPRPCENNRQFTFGSMATS